MPSRPYASEIEPIPGDGPRPVAEGRIGVVVMIDSLARPGGGERLAVENAIGLDPDRYRRWLAITRWDPVAHVGPGPDELLGRLGEAGVTVLKLERRGPFDLRAWLPLVRLLRSGQVDVLHGHLFGSNVWASVLGGLTRIPAVVSHEHMWSYDAASRLRPFLDRNLVARLSDAFVAVSRQGLAGMLEVERIPPERIAYVPNGVRPMAPGDSGRLRSALSIDPRVPVVVSVGHLREEKSFGTLVTALAEPAAAEIGLHAVVAGEGPERAGLENRARELGVDGRLHLLGARDDVPDVLAAANVAVCCSRFEGGPLSVMEYMQAGLPVVASDVGGLPELVREGETGMLVPPGDASGFAGAIRRLIDEEPLAAALGNAGRDLVASEYSQATWIARLETLYARLLGPRDSASGADAPTRAR